VVRGLNREAAAKFSFLLSVIVIAGAGALEAYDVVSSGETVPIGTLPMVFGFLSSALVGYLAIRLLLELLPVSCVIFRIT
jgi:undecaprenyl-diphosphatase